MMDENIEILVRELNRKDMAIAHLEAENERLSRENIALKLNAEAVEARVSGANKLAMETNARLNRAERRVAELEARLADEWRPVTEPPKEEGEYLGWEDDGARRRIIVSYDPDLDYEDSWAWGDWYGDSTPITHWRPLPPPPAATE